MHPDRSPGPYRTIPLPQGDLRYREAGDGLPVVFLHGLLVNGDLWRLVVPHISPHARCILPDLPLGGHQPAMPAGADLSPTGLARLVADFLAALDLRDVTLVGSDTGGGIAQIVIANHPDRVARLVLLNCDAYKNFPPPRIAPVKWGAFVPGFAAAVAKLLHWVPVSGRLIYALVARHRPGQEILDGYFAPFIRDRDVRRDVTKVIRGVAPRHTLTAAARFGAFPGSVLIAWGTDDRIFSDDDARRLARDFPNARLKWISGSRTFVSEDQPEYLAALIREFLGQPAVQAA